MTQNVSEVVGTTVPVAREISLTEGSSDNRVIRNP